MSRSYDYRYLRDMDPAPRPFSGKNFFVHLAGNTNDAHRDIVRMLVDIGQNQVSSPGASDYLLVFCPIASRVGTDISEALDNLPDKNKPVMLVVMHHTFQPEHVVIPSSRQVDNPNVFLTVDVLFYNRDLLKSTRNEIAWSEIQKALGYSPSQASKQNPGRPGETHLLMSETLGVPGGFDSSWFKRNMKVTIIVGGGLILVGVIIIVSVIAGVQSQK
ncbi:uncharacterized protein LOC131991215 isoform X2 [Centropristis striata]|uniref:uncharacterized protein LOC131991215 isoform X2 n=1 Tax=Centropristis striata TaxID=184440 RepID=UPI0027E106E2|nr:uncharacterized protein LOC131991215 isoform X2 [Centropristis striata]